MSDTENNGAGVSPEAHAWPTVLEEAFKSAPEGWSFAATASTPPLRFDAPGVVVTLPGGETSVAAYWYEKQQFTDFALSVTITLLSAQEPTQSYSGVSFRARSDKDNYRLFIDGDGYFRLTRRVDNASHALIDHAVAAPEPRHRARQPDSDHRRGIDPDHPRQRQATGEGHGYGLHQRAHRPSGAGGLQGDRERHGVQLPRR